MIEQIVVRPLEETDMSGVLDLRYRVLDEPKGLPGVLLHQPDRGLARGPLAFLRGYRKRR